MKYFPKSRILTNQTANPGQFKNPDGSDYTGPYYTTFDGKSFTGIDPSKGSSIPLTPSLVSSGLSNTDARRLRQCVVWYRGSMNAPLVYSRRGLPPCLGLLIDGIIGVVLDLRCIESALH